LELRRAAHDVDRQSFADGVDQLPAVVADPATDLLRTRGEEGVERLGQDQAAAYVRRQKALPLQRSAELLQRREERRVDREDRNRGRVGVSPRERGPHGRE